MSINGKVAPKINAAARDVYFQFGISNEIPRLRSLKQRQEGKVVCVEVLWLACSALVGKGVC
jgi:hypothetical protein